MAPWTKAAPVVAAVLALVPGVAQAHKPFLSMRRGEAAMVRDARLDQPASISVSRCRRVSRVHVVCMVDEAGATNVLSMNEAVTPVDVSWETSARLARGRVLVTLF